MHRGGTANVSPKGEKSWTLQRGATSIFFCSMSSPAAVARKRFKVVLLGDLGVGKSSLVLRLVKDEFHALQPTIGASFCSYHTTVDDITVDLEIWDTAGQEKFKSLAPMYYRGAAAAMVVYDIASSDSFECAKFWIRELMTNNREAMITLVGNKCDLEEQRRVSQEDAKKYADEGGLLHFEASAKDGTRVQAVFQEAARKLALSRGNQEN